MSVAAFDTLKLVRSLRDKAKFSPEQAEGMADALAEAMQSDLATKVALRETELRLDAKIETIRQGLDAKIETTRQGLDAKIEATRLGLDAKIEATRLGLETKIEATKVELVRWLVGLIGFQTLTMIIIAKIFH